MFKNVDELIIFIESQKRNESKISLDYFRNICNIYGNPQNKKKLIHIGGTNGKGSTVSFIQNILINAGYNVGTYISPYIICFNERITYNKEYISNEELLRVGNYIYSKYPEIESRGLRTPSFFEFMTLMSFIYFSEIKELDYAIIEVGIGGLLDTTNVINPIASAITNVSLDHENVLGNTLGQIWDNKLGIVKKDVPFFTIKNNDYKEKVIDKCNQVGASLKLVNREDVTNIKITTEYTEFDYLDFPAIRLQMLGAHQIENAILALEICRGIKGINLSKENIYRGIKSTFWPGRLEIVSKNPLIIIDGSHNVGGITALSEFIEVIKKQHKVRLIFAVSANKNKEAMIALFEPHVDEIIFTHFMYKRSDESLNLYNLSKHVNKTINDNIDEIVELTKKPNEYLNIYCGSLYFISEIRNKF